MEAIFANIQNGLIFRILGVFKSGFFAENNYILCVGSFLICFWQFYFLIQSDDFGKALHGGNFCQYSKWSHFSNIRCF